MLQQIPFVTRASDIVAACCYQQFQMRGIDNHGCKPDDFSALWPFGGQPITWRKLLNSCENSCIYLWLSARKIVGSHVVGFDTQVIESADLVGPGVVPVP